VISAAFYRDVQDRAGLRRPGSKCWSPWRPVRRDGRARPRSALAATQGATCRTRRAPCSLLSLSP